MTGTEAREALVVDAFTTTPLDGVPVGVVPDASGLDGGQRRAVAGELAPSATAFHDGAGTLRVLDGDGERAERGDAAVAAVASGALDPGAVEGLDVDLDDGVAWVDAGVPTVDEADVDAARTAGALGVDPAAVVGELPLGVADAGVSLLVVPLDFLSVLADADPDPATLSVLCDAADADGVYALTFDTLAAGPNAHGRVFAPSRSVETVPATAAAAGYLRWADAYDDPPTDLAVEFGHVDDRPGLARARVDGGTWVGGNAVTSLTGEIRVPPATDDDDIVEA